MAKRTYRPHIRIEAQGRSYNSLTGWIDWAILGVRMWECVGYGATGVGLTPKTAYDAWYREFLLPAQNGAEFMAAYTNTKYPKGLVSH